MPVNEHALEIAAHLITAKAGPEEVLDAALNAALDSTDAKRGFVALVDRRNGELVIRKIAGEGWTPDTRDKRLRTGSGVHEGIVGYVATTGQAYHTGDVAGDPHYYPLFDDVRSELAAPLTRSGNRVTGVLNLEATEPDAFTDEDERMVSALAALASVAVSMAEHHRREHELATVAQELNREGDLSQKLSVFTDAAASIVRALDSSLFILQPDGRTLTLAASQGLLRAKVGEASYTVGEGLTGWVAQQGTPVRLEDMADDPRWIGKHEEIPQDQVAGFLAVPVVDEEGKVEGVLRVLRDKTPKSLPNPFDDEDERVLTTLASQVAVVLHRQRLLRRVLQSERLAAWGQLSARAAHIIGNRVFAMRGAVSELKHLLDTGAGCSGDCAELLETLSRSLSETDRIVQSFKDFVAAREVKSEAVDINRLVEATIKGAEGSARQVQISADLADQLPTVCCDATRLTEVFEELVENAIAWQPEGGAVRVLTSAVAGSEAAQIAAVGREPDYVRVDIEDEGPGVAPELKEKIFEPFFSSRGRGLGLGLAICREVVRAQGGEIVEIGRDGGGHFVVLLPVAREEEVAP
jgi:signal transduction histidine kinase